VSQPQVVPRHRNVILEAKGDTQGEAGIVEDGPERRIARRRGGPEEGELRVPQSQEIGRHGRVGGVPKGTEVISFPLSSRTCHWPVEGRQKAICAWASPR